MLKSEGYSELRLKVIKAVRRTPKSEKKHFRQIFKFSNIKYSNLNSKLPND